MQCLILAGGLGTRVKHLSGDKPKALLPIGNKTFIDWQLQWLFSLGVTEAILALGHGSEIIEGHLKKRLKAPIPALTFSYDGATLLGTGGAIKKAKSHLKENFTVIYGDSFLFLDLKKFAQTHVAQKKPLTLSIFKNESEGDRSNVIFHQGQIKSYDKVHMTPDMHYIDYGMSFLNRDAFVTNTPEGQFDFADYVHNTCKAGQAAAYEAHEIFQEVGSPEGYNRFTKLMTSVNFDLQTLKSRLS